MGRVARAILDVVSRRGAFNSSDATRSNLAPNSSDGDLRAVDSSDPEFGTFEEQSLLLRFADSVYEAARTAGLLDPSEEAMAAAVRELAQSADAAPDKNNVGAFLEMMTDFPCDPPTSDTDTRPVASPIDLSHSTESTAWDTHAFGDTEKLTSRSGDDDHGWPAVSLLHTAVMQLERQLPDEMRTSRHKYYVSTLDHLIGQLLPKVERAAKGAHRAMTHLEKQHESLQAAFADLERRNEEVEVECHRRVEELEEMLRSSKENEKLLRRRVESLARLVDEDDVLERALAESRAEVDYLMTRSAAARRGTPADETSSSSFDIASQMGGGVSPGEAAALQAKASRMERRASRFERQLREARTEAEAAGERGDALQKQYTSLRNEFEVLRNRESRVSEDRFPPPGGRGIGRALGTLARRHSDADIKPSTAYYNTMADSSADSSPLELGPTLAEEIVDRTSVSKDEQIARLQDELVSKDSRLQSLMEGYTHFLAPPPQPAGGGRRHLTRVGASTEARRSVGRVPFLRLFSLG